MTAALIPSLLVLFAVAFATADPQMNVVGEGFMSHPVTSTASGKGMRYAGPVVYTNEKPPIIYFPPPPKDAKPGFGPGGGLGFFGKNKSPKSIKYVPMPHHDLPVLIYTSDKTPPIHVVSPPNNESPRGPISFGPGKDDNSGEWKTGPPPGSLASAYRGILPAASSARVVTSSYEIPSTSYGSPMKAFGGSLDLPTSSSEGSYQKQQYSTVSFGPSSSSGSESSGDNVRSFGVPSKKPPHIMYSGHPPIHIFNEHEPDMFVRAPKEIPLKSFEELPPKASFGPPKSSFEPPSYSSISYPIRHHRRPISTSSVFDSPQRPGGSPYLEENLIAVGSSNRPTSVHPSKNNEAPFESSSISYGGGNPPAGPPTYSFSPQQSMFSFGPFSIEYGPPSEPLMSFSEPTGSLSSLYGTVGNAENGKPAPSEAGSGREIGSGREAGSDGWIPGPPPSDMIGEGQTKENEWDAPPSHFHHPPSGYNGPPKPMHSVFLPSSNSRPHHPHHPRYPPPFGGSRIANFISSFKLKRNKPKPKYAIAPKSMHKPPIIIYYGKKPPVHVYQKPETEETTFTAAASSPSYSITTVESTRNEMGSDNGNSNEAVRSATSFDNVDLTYGGSQNTEVRVVAPAISSISSDSHNMKPAIIQAKPVDIFSSSELQPSIYMARNSLNTIYVSDLSGSGTKTLKTFIVRRSEDPMPNRGRLTVTEATVFPPQQQQQQEGGSIIISNIAQDRISGEQVLVRSQRQPEQQQQEQLMQVVPISAPEGTQVDLEQLSQQDVEDNRGASSNEAPTTTVLVAPLSPSQSGEEMGNENGSKEQSPGSRKVQVAIIQSPSSFQSSLSRAEKEAEEAQQVDDEESSS